MNDQQRVDQQGRVWLERGVTAARAGRRAEAREALFRALNDESQREMAWLWLAAVSDDPRQERVYLEKVLSLNPDNRHAKAGLAQLEKRHLENIPSPAVLDLDDREVVSPAGSLPDVEPPATVSAESDQPKSDSPPPAPPSRQMTVQEVTQEPILPSETGAESKGTKTEQEPPKTKEARKKPPVAKAQTVEMPASPPVRSPARKKETQPAARQIEPTGWTTQSPKVESRSDKPKSVEPSGWTRTAPKVSPRPQPVRRPVREPAQVPRPAPQPVEGGGQLAMILGEAFHNHETWTVLTATASLVLLAVILIVVFALSLLSG